MNRELEVLERALESLAARLAPGGRFGVITFHSLEDRLVKQFFQSRSAEQVDDPTWPARAAESRPSLSEGHRQGRHRRRSRAARQPARAQRQAARRRKTPTRTGPRPMNRRRHANVIPIFSLATWLVLFFALGAGGLYYVNFKNQLLSRGTQIKTLEKTPRRAAQRKRSRADADRQARLAQCAAEALGKPIAISSPATSPSRSRSSCSTPKRRAAASCAPSPTSIR